MSLRRTLCLSVTGLMALWLAACASPGIPVDPVGHLQAPVPVASAQAVQLPGADVAFLVNQRYRATPSKCFVSSPAFECSGVLLRTLPPGTANAAFWRVSPDELTQGYAELGYARVDLPPVDTSNSVGFVLVDRPTAAGTGQPYDLKCGPEPLGQHLQPCAHDPDEVGVSLWDASAPAALAVQAIFYDVAHGGQLAEALRDQKQYFDATGVWVPILRASLGTGDATAFGFNDEDQLPWGYAVVRDLEARHADTRMTCPGNKPAYFCSGVLIRNSGYGPTFHSWNPTPHSVTRNGVSFSYARNDMNMRGTVWNLEGLVMKELQAPTEQPLEWRCSFPTDGGTGNRSNSCNLGNDFHFCDELGIDTAAKFMQRYGTGYSFNACALAPNEAQFRMLVDLRQTMNSTHNEVVIAAWEQDIPEKIPLEAFFYPSAATKSGAQSIQQDYMAMTGRFMPVLFIDLTKPPGQIYTYNPNDQAGAMRPDAMFSTQSTHGSSGYSGPGDGLR